MMMDEMMQENPNEQQPAARSLPKKARRRLKWFQYQWILGNVPYFLFLSVLAIVYIYNGHYADKTLRSISKMGRELKDMQYEFKILKGEVTFRSKQSELAKAVAPMGLHELVQPPAVLNDSAMTVNPK